MMGSSHGTESNWQGGNSRRVRPIIAVWVGDGTDRVAQCSKYLLEQLLVAERNNGSLHELWIRSSILMVMLRAAF